MTTTQIVLLLLTLFSAIYYAVAWAYVNKALSPVYRKEVDESLGYAMGIGLVAALLFLFVTITRASF